MIDAKRLLDSFLGGGQAGQGAGTPTHMPRSGGFGPLVTGGAAGSVIAMLLGSKQGRKIGGKLVGYGGAALLAGLAYKAYRDWSDDRQAAPAQGTTGTTPAPLPPAGTGFDLESARSADGGDLRLALVRAMIAAAKADGHVDATEHRHLAGRIAELQLSAEEKGFLMDELGKPLDVDAIARLAGNREQASEIWLASRVAIDPDDFREKAYLDALAKKLDLPADLIEHLEAQIAAVASS
jgi:uncharacterized membrane protein YebE (DUF533 family)